MKFISLLSNKAISRLISLALILLFAIGIAPKQFLHDLFAHHTDKSVLLKASEIAHVHTSGFQCDTESTVATSPFEATGDIAYIQPKKIFQRHSSRLETPLFTDSHRAIDLRGPPKVG